MCLFAVLFLSACVRPSPAVVGDPARGAALFSRQQIRDTSGCASCHSLEPGRMVVGPSLADVATRARVKIASTGYGGEAATVQDDLRESITRPTADLVPGFAHGIMPDWLTVLDRQEIEDLTAFLMTLESAPQMATGPARK